MTTDKPERNPAATSTGKPARSAGGAKPEWANGLRQLYDSVVDEPIPDTFKDLLAKLDTKS